MNPEFKLRFDQMRQGDPSKPDNVSAADGENALYHPMGFARNLCLVWPDGGRYFLNYAYLISAEFVVGDDMNKITLNFSSHTAILNGHGLEPLYMEFLDHLPKLVFAVDPRYLQNKSANNILVVNMAVEINPH